MQTLYPHVNPKSKYRGKRLEGIGASKFLWPKSIVEPQEVRRIVEVQSLETASSTGMAQKSLMVSNGFV